MIPFVTPFEREPLTKQDRSAFQRGPTERRLRVWVDTGALSGDSISEALVSFRHHDQIDLAMLSPENVALHDDGGAALTWEDVRGGTHQSGFVPARHNLQALQNLGYDFNTEPEVARRCLIAMFAARGCDALVTTPFVAAIASRMYSACNPVSQAEALATIGVFLRLREDFVFRQSANGRVDAGSSTFYQVLAADLIPESWRWGRLCPGPENAFHPSPRGLANAIPARVARSLRARDRALGQLFRVPTTATIDEALFYFDGFLMSWVAAFDAAARVLHSCYQLPSRPSWRFENWTKALADADAGYVSLATTTSPESDVLQLLYVLRNLIHEEPLKIVGMLSPSGNLVEYHAAISRQARDRLASSIGRLGGADALGFGYLGEDGLSLDLHKYIETMLPRLASILNKLMQTARLENFGAIGELEWGAPRDPIWDSLERFRGLGGIERQS